MGITNARNLALFSFPYNVSRWTQNIRRSVCKRLLIVFFLTVFTFAVINFKFHRQPKLVRAFFYFFSDVHCSNGSNCSFFTSSCRSRSSNREERRLPDVRDGFQHSGVKDDVDKAPSGCESECQDPFSSDLFKSVENNCSSFRFVAIPDDGGRFGHVMSQVHILLAFHRMLEARKRLTGRGSHVTHVPVLNRHQEVLLCQLFERPRNVYLSLPLVRDVCNVGAGGEPSETWTRTSLRSWESDFDAIAERNVFLETWPMPRMHLQGNGDIYREVFRIHPGWTRRADRVLDDFRKRLNRDSSYDFVFVHVRRTDYLDIVTREWRVPGFQGRHVNKLILHAAARRPNAVFLILGDDENWCRKNILFGPKVLLVPTRRQELAFAVMAKCDAGIITYGSFGLWAGILGGGNLTRLLPSMSREKLAEHILNTEEVMPNVEFVFYR